MRYVAEHPDAEFARSITQTGTLFFLLRNQPDIPLEEEPLAEVMKRPLYEHQSPEVARKGAMELLAENDVRGFFHNDGPSISVYAFRHGRIEAPELLAKLAARFP